MPHHNHPITSSATNANREGASPRSRAEASRLNGAKSRGPKTPDGKARSSLNSLKHGLRAKQAVVLSDEDAAEFEQFSSALMVDLAPVGALEEEMAERFVRAAWRARRSDRIEVGILDKYVDDLVSDQEDAEKYSPPEVGEVPKDRTVMALHNLGFAFMRDGNNARAIDTMLRYRGLTQAESHRALVTLKALQAERAEREERGERELREVIEGLLDEKPNEPETAGQRGVRPVSDARTQRSD